MSIAWLPPLGAVLHVQPAGWRSALKLWLPLFLLWLLLLPLLVLALPLLAVGALILRVRLWRSLRLVVTVLAALRGTCVEMSRREMRVFIQLH